MMSCGPNWTQYTLENIELFFYTCIAVNIVLIYVNTETPTPLDVRVIFFNVTSET